MSFFKNIFQEHLFDHQQCAIFQMWILKAQSLTRSRLKQYQRDQETGNSKAATGGHHGDVVRGMKTQKKVSLFVN